MDAPMEDTSEGVVVREPIEASQIPAQLKTHVDAFSSVMIKLKGWKHVAHYLEAECYNRDENSYGYMYTIKGDQDYIDYSDTLDELCKDVYDMLTEDFSNNATPLKSLLCFHVLENGSDPNETVHYDLMDEWEYTGDTS